MVIPCITDFLVNPQASVVQNTYPPRKEPVGARQVGAFRRIYVQSPRVQPLLAGMPRETSMLHATSEKAPPQFTP